MNFLSGAIPVMNPVMDLNHGARREHLPERASVFSVARGHCNKSTSHEFLEWRDSIHESSHGSQSWGAQGTFSRARLCLLCRLEIQGGAVKRRSAEEGASRQVPARAPPSESKEETLTRLTQTGESSSLDSKKYQS